MRPSEQGLIVARNVNWTRRLAEVLGVEIGEWREGANGESKFIINSLTSPNNPKFRHSLALRCLLTLKSQRYLDMATTILREKQDIEDANTKDFLTEQGLDAFYKIIGSDVA